jgi:CBS-domain-containing membrane protein
MSERERFDAAREQPAPHTGPTAERYRSALHRYVAAISAADPRGAAVMRSPLQEAYRWNLENNLVRDVMSENVVSVTVDTPFKAIVDTLATCRVSAVPVVDADFNVLGVVSESDLLAKVVAGGDPRVRVGTGRTEKAERRRKSHAETAGELMRSPAVTVRPEASVVHAARVAALEHVRRLPVVDAHGVLAGIVTRSDLLRVFLRDDRDIREHLDSLFADQFCIDTSAVDISVRDGVVTLTGQLERRGLIAPLLDAVRTTAGVIGVHDNLTYRFDDTFAPAPRGPML